MALELADPEPAWLGLVRPAHDPQRRTDAVIVWILGFWVLGCLAMAFVGASVVRGIADVRTQVMVALLGAMGVIMFGGATLAWMEMWH